MPSVMERHRERGLGLALLTFLGLLSLGPPAAAAAAAAATATGSEPPLVFPDRVKADVALIVAHPDDEGAAAPLLARWGLEEKKRVVAIYLTSGDLGTDRVGRVRGPAFGYMRLTELHWT